MFFYKLYRSFECERQNYILFLKIINNYQQPTDDDDVVGK